MPRGRRGHKAFAPAGVTLRRAPGADARRAQPSQRLPLLEVSPAGARAAPRRPATLRPASGPPGGRALPGCPPHAGWTRVRPDVTRRARLLAAGACSVALRPAAGQFAGIPWRCHGAAQRRPARRDPLAAARLRPPPPCAPVARRRVLTRAPPPCAARVRFLSPADEQAKPHASELLARYGCAPRVWRSMLNQGGNQGNYGAGSAPGPPYPLTASHGGACRAPRRARARRGRTPAPRRRAASRTGLPASALRSLSL